MNAAQDIAVWLIVVVAAAYLARLAWRTLTNRKHSGCGACANCPSEGQATEPNVVELTPTSKASRQS